jgi:hypothetical protein
MGCGPENGISLRRAADETFFPTALLGGDFGEQLAL